MPKETVLVTAGPGAGKSTWMWQMILAALEADKEYRVWIFDNERKMRGVARLFGGVPEGVTILNTHKHDTTMDAVRGVWKEIRNEPEGFGIVAIDMIEKWWERAQEYYVQRLARGVDGEEGDDEDLAFAEHVTRLAAKRHEKAEARGTIPKEVSPFESGFVDWPVVKQWHNAMLVERLLYDMPCHVLATCGSRGVRHPVDEKGRDNPIHDDNELINLWTPFGSVPLGEKNNSYRFTTLMGLEKVGIGEPVYRLTLVKDQTRMLGKPNPMFERKKLEPDDNGIYDLWLEYSSRVPGAPRVLEIDK